MQTTRLLMQFPTAINMARLGDTPLAGASCGFFLWAHRIVVGRVGGKPRSLKTFCGSMRNPRGVRILRQKYLERCKGAPVKFKQAECIGKPVDLEDLGMYRWSPEI